MNKRFSLLSRFGVSAACSVFAAGCASLKEAPKPELGRTKVRESWSAGATAAPVMDGWLASFGDPQLTSLVAEAVRHNPDLEGTAARLEQALANARAAGAALWPAVDVGIGGQNTTRLRRTSAQQRAGVDQSSGSFGASLDLSWELDVWGRLRYNKRGAAGSALASEQDYLAARRSLAAQVAKAWFAAAEARLQQELSQNFVRTYEETLRLVQARFKAGAISEQDLANARADLAGARQRAQATSTTFKEAVRSLEVLLGRYPGAELEVTTDLQAVSVPIPAGLPSELLERRADIVAAERRLAAAFNASSAANAARLPRIALTSSVGTSSGALQELLNPNNAAINFAANLFAPLFDAGLLRSQFEGAEAQQREAAANYRSTAIRAFAEVESALVSEDSLAREEEELRVAAQQYETARRIAEARYKEGAISLTDVLVIQRQELQSKSSLLAIRNQRLAQRINLHLALGGDFANSAPQLVRSN